MGRKAKINVQELQKLIRGVQNKAVVAQQLRVSSAAKRCNGVMAREAASRTALAGRSWKTAFYRARLPAKEKEGRSDLEKLKRHTPG